MLYGRQTLAGDLADAAAGEEDEALTVRKATEGGDDSSEPFTPTREDDAALAVEVDRFAPIHGRHPHRSAIAGSNNSCEGQNGIPADCAQPDNARAPSARAPDA